MGVFHSKTFRMYYICKDRVHYVAMPCSQFGYIISGVMNMVCCCAIFSPLFVYCICLNLRTMTDIECTQKCIYMYVHVYVL